MAVAQGASTSPSAAHAATQAMLAPVPGERGGTAVDGLFAGFLALCLEDPSILLGAGMILVAGVGEGHVVVDGRARQPGLGAQRPRGAKDGEVVPDAARVATPGIAAAVLRAHAGRGVKTPSALAREAIASFELTSGKPHPLRLSSVRAFGREGAQSLRAGAIHDALLAATPRSLGGTLTDDDLAHAAPGVSTAPTEAFGGRTWAFASEGPTEADSDDAPFSIDVVAAADAFGAVAIAAIARAHSALPLAEVGLSAPLFARPVLRGVARLSPGAHLPFVAPIGVARSSGDRAVFDLAVGVGGAPAIASREFASLRAALGDLTRPLDDAFAPLLAPACGVYRGTADVRVFHRRVAST